MCNDTFDPRAVPVWWGDKPRTPLIEALMMLTYYAGDGGAAQSVCYAALRGLLHDESEAEVHTWLLEQDHKLTGRMGHGFNSVEHLREMLGLSSQWVD